MTAQQIKYAFDKITMSKIFRGALIALSGSAALGLLDYLKTVQFTNPTLILFVAWAIPTAVNIVKEWMAGETIVPPTPVQPAQAQAQPQS